MAIDKLRYFAAVVETKNLRKAAEIVGIAPGSMSKAISTLESELGVKLLRPEGRGIEITSQGLLIYNQSTRLLDEYRRFQNSLKETPSVHNEKLRLGTFEVFSTYFLSSFFCQEVPDHDALLLELTPGNMEKAILENLIDFGVTYLPSPNPRLTFTEIGQFEMKIWGLKKWKKIDFNEWPFAVPTTSFQIHSNEHSSLDMWPQSKKERRIKYEFELLETALQTSRQGLSVLHCPDFIINIHNESVLKEFKLEHLPYPHPLKPMKPIKIFLISNKENNININLEGKLAKFLRSLKQRFGTTNVPA
ncbi:MAG: LysR family transcriptional regulator [Bdellovibrio sp.]